MTIAILGAGLTGLTSGYLLTTNQMLEDYDILEKDKECGGLMRSLQKDGFTFDYGGSHIIFSKDEEAFNFMINLLGGNKIKNRRNTKILYRDRFVKYPFENGLADLPREDNFECLYYFIQNLIQKGGGEIALPSNLKDWCYYTFGEGIAEKYLLPYNEKIWKYPTEKTSLEWVERIPNPPLEDIIKSSLGIETEGYTHQLYFYYPKIGGIQALIDRLEEKIAEHIVTNYEIRTIRNEDGKWILSNGKEERSYDKIISTIPIHDLINALDAPGKIKNAVNNLKYNSLITVMIGLNTPKINDLTWLYIPDKSVLTHRVSFPSNYSPYVVPEGKSSVLAEITCNNGDEIWMMTDDEITERIIEDLNRTKIIDEKDVCFKEVRRIKYAYVINDLNYQENLSMVEDFLRKVGIDLVGRFSEFRYLNMDGCIRSAENLIKLRRSGCGGR